MAFLPPTPLPKRDRCHHIGHHYELHLVYNIQGVSRLVDITAGGDFLGLFDKKKVHINMCPILDGYGVMGIF